MKKTLIASAVAAATLSSTAFAMDNASDLAARLDSMPSVYGNIQLAWTNQTTDNNMPNGEYSTNEFMDNGSTIGFKHSHAISDGLEGFFKAEFHFDADEGGYQGVDVDDDEVDDGVKGGLGEKLDEAYIGVKGDFGSIQIGTDDNVYEDFVDFVDTDEFAGISDFGGDLAADEEGDTVKYISPDMSGLSVGVQAPIDSDSTFGGQIAVSYSMDMIQAALAYSIGREEGDCQVACDAAGDAIGVAVSAAIEDLTLMLQYETLDESQSQAKDSKDFLGLQAAYAMGANNFVLGYGMATDENGGGLDEEETSTLYIQALHNISEHMYTYIEYIASNTEDDNTGAAKKDEDENWIVLGATYAF